MKGILERPAARVLVASLVFAAVSAHAEEPPSGPAALATAPAADADAEDEYELRALRDAKALEPTLQRALRRGDDFCEDAERSLEVEERQLCSLSSAARARCPGFSRACDDYAKDISRRGLNASSGLLKLLGGLLTVGFWVIVIAGAALLLATLVTAALRRRRAAVPLESPAQPGNRAAVHVLRVNEAMLPAELLANARELAERGLFKEAMAQALRALLRGLEIRGVLELTPSRTNGEYARRLRGKGGVEVEFRAVAREVEAVEFGGQGASRERFAAVYSRVERLVGGTSLLLLLACVPGLTACGAKAQGSSIGSCGTGAHGYSAFCELFAVSRGVAPKLRFQRLEAVPDDVDQVIVLEDVLSQAERAVLLAWVARGNTLLIKDQLDAYFPDHSIRLAAADASCGDALALADMAWDVSPDARRFRLPGARMLVAAGGQVLARCGEHPFAIKSSRGVGAIVSLADRRFFTNASLAIDDNAVLAMALTLAGRTLVVGRWTGAGSDAPLQAISRAGLLPWLIHLLVLGLAFALYRGAPFGSRRELVKTPRRAFSEHVEALGAAYARAHASGLVLFHYGSWALDRLRTRAGASGNARLSELGSALSRQLPVREADVTKLVVAVRFAGDEKNDSGNESEHLATARELGELVTKVGK